MKCFEEKSRQAEAFREESQVVQGFQGETCQSASLSTGSKQRRLQRLRPIKRSGI